MAVLPAELLSRASRAAAEISKALPVRAAYLFGSYVTGKNHEYSDIDLGLFVEDWDSVSFQSEVALTLKVSRQFGADLEFHFFDAGCLEDQEGSSFAGAIVHRGVRLEF